MDFIKSESKWNLPFLPAGVFLLSLILLSHWAFGGWTHESSWKQLQKNMPSDVVEQLLGAPKEKEETSLRSVWYYQQTPTRENGKVISRPKQGYVNFSKLSRNPVTHQRLDGGGLFVSTWAVPDWGAITEEEKKADIPEVDLTLSPLSAEFEQHHQEIIKQQEEQRRLMEAQRKQLEAEIERQRKAAMERVQKRQQEMQQRMQDVNFLANNTSQRNFASPTMPTSPAATPVGQPAQQQQQRNLQTARQTGAIIGFVIIILVLVVLVLLVFLLIKKLLS
jgi:hypothetical protein